MDNLILMSDSYKVSHHRQYPQDTQNIYSYFESRGGEFNKTVFFGLQYYLKKYLEPGITPKMVQEAKEIFTQHFGSDKLFNEEGWRIILDDYNGKLPVRIKAVPEGTLVDVSNVLMTIENTDPRLYWLTNYLETLLVQVWYPTTVATLSFHMRKLIDQFAELNGDPSLVNFKLHDFGFRGVSSVESAMTGGLSHLLNFMGTDTVASLVCAKDYYSCESAPGFSIPAAEHSTITAWGRDHEADAYKNMLEQYPEGIVAIVSDSYDIYNACENLWGGELKQQVLDRKGSIVIRPDSGNPPEVVVKVLDILGEKFGFSINEKGYKVLMPKVRVIQGDGIDYDMCSSILNRMNQNKWSVDNIAFGMGGALLQKLHRDTQKFAFKCSAIKREGKWEDVYKTPITDPGKNSKRGRLVLYYNPKENKYETYKEPDYTQPQPHAIPDSLETVFEDGNIVKEYTFQQCKERVEDARVARSSMDRKVQTV